MALKLALFACLAAVAYAQLPLAYNPNIARLGLAARFQPRYEEELGPAEYQFQYDVNDPETFDIKSQQETRDGNALRGTYSLVQPDGLRRIVEYSDEGAGLVAIVRYEDAGVRIPQPVPGRFAPGFARFAPAAVLP